MRPNSTLHELSPTHRDWKQHARTKLFSILRRGTGFAALLARIGSCHTRGPHQRRQCGIACRGLDFPEPGIHLVGDGALHAPAVVSMPPRTAKNGARVKG